MGSWGFCSGWSVSGVGEVLVLGGGGWFLEEDEQCAYVVHVRQ